LKDEIDYTECIFNNHFDLNCIALIDSDTCGLCKSGFEVDSVGVCQQIDIDNCLTLHASATEQYIPVKARWFRRDGKCLVYLIEGFFGDRQSDYFQYYGLFKEGFGCFECSSLFSLLSTSQKRCIPKENDPKAMNYSLNGGIPNCFGFFYENSGNNWINSKVLLMNLL
jgi:hypothetical protein